MCERESLREWDALGESEGGCEAEHRVLISALFCSCARGAALLARNQGQGGHLSCCAVLQAGVPMITTPRESMISRVAPSLCLAGGLPQMGSSSLARGPCFLCARTHHMHTLRHTDIARERWCWNH